MILSESFDANCDRKCLFSCFEHILACLFLFFDSFFFIIFINWKKKIIIEIFSSKLVQNEKLTIFFHPFHLGAASLWPMAMHTMTNANIKYFKKFILFFNWLCMIFFLKILILRDDPSPHTFFLILQLIDADLHIFILIYLFQETRSKTTDMRYLSGEPLFFASLLFLFISYSFSRHVYIRYVYLSCIVIQWTTICYYLFFNVYVSFIISSSDKICFCLVNIGEWRRSVIALRLEFLTQTLSPRVGGQPKMYDLFKGDKVLYRKGYQASGLIEKVYVVFSLLKKILSRDKGGPNWRKIWRMFVKFIRLKIMQKKKE